MNVPAGCAALVSVAAMTVVLAPAPLASADGGLQLGTGGGCVSDEQYAQLSTGQRLSVISSVLARESQIGETRRWASGLYAYQERLYAMCTPRNRDHATLTTRFLYYEGAWRAQIVDTLVGPEK